MRYPILACIILSGTLVGCTGGSVEPTTATDTSPAPPAAPLLVDESATETDNCDPNATCIDTVTAFTCVCDNGFAGNGITCVDIDECGTAVDNCSDDAVCKNHHGGFTCACKDGFTGDGVTCSDVDECSEGTNNCGTIATCANTTGSFTCACPAGFTGNGFACVDNDECTLGTDHCHANATCTNIPGSFTCACNIGYAGDGVTACADVDECTLGTDDCLPDATCSNVMGSYSCTCTQGYTGDGSTSCAPTSATAWTDVDGGTDTTCGISGGKLYCWGQQSGGGLGDGGINPGVVPAPVEISSGTSWSAVSYGDEHGCAIRGDGTGWCWGRNNYGELGFGGSGPKAVPTAVHGGYNDWVAIEAGTYHTCGLRSSGQAYCWGINTNPTNTSDVWGMLGNGGVGITQNKPGGALQCGGSDCSFTDLVVHAYRTCAVENITGDLYCWGRGDNGGLANGSTTHATVPTLATAPAGGAAWNTNSLALNDMSTCGVRDNGSLWCAGSRLDATSGIGGFLADGLVTGQSDSFAGPDLAGWATLGAGSRVTCGVDANADGACWGADTSGALGNGPGAGDASTPSALDVHSAFKWTTFGGGLAHTCGIRTDGTLWCWGRDTDEQLGDGFGATDRHSPGIVLIP